MEIIRRNIQEIQELLQADPLHLVKCECFARQTLENLLLEIRDVAPRPLNIAEVYPLIGATEAILRMIKG